MVKGAQSNKCISVVIPVYNEDESVLFVLDDLVEVFERFEDLYRFEIVFVDDCSTDSSVEMIQSRVSMLPEDFTVRIVKLCRNSGSHIAISAGLSVAKGDLIVIMASDGQDPAAVINEFVLEWLNGNVLILASRSDNLGQGFLSKLVSRIAWRIMNWCTNLEMPANGCDMLAMDKRVAKSYNSLKERNTTFVFKLLALGFKFKECTYVKRNRFGGKSKWNFYSKLSIMIDAITGFTNRPLRLIAKCGILVFVVMVLRWLIIVYKVYVLGQIPSELSIVLNTVLVVFSIIVLLLAFIGDYVWRILDETRQRPEFEIEEVIELNKEE